MTMVGPVGTGSVRAAATTPGASGRSAVAAGCADWADCPAAAVADCAAAGGATCAWVAAGKPAIAKASAAVSAIVRAFSAIGRAVVAIVRAIRTLRRVTPMREISVDATEHRLTHNRPQPQPCRE